MIRVAWCIGAGCFLTLAGCAQLCVSVCSDVVSWLYSPCTPHGLQQEAACMAVRLGMRVLWQNALKAIVRWCACFQGHLGCFTWFEVPFVMAAQRELQLA